MLLPCESLLEETQRRIPKKEMDIVPMIAASFKALAPNKATDHDPGENPAK